MIDREADIDQAAEPTELRPGGMPLWASMAAMLAIVVGAGLSALLGLPDGATVLLTGALVALSVVGVPMVARSGAGLRGGAVEAPVRWHGEFVAPARIAELGDHAGADAVLERA